MRSNSQSLLGGIIIHSSFLPHPNRRFRRSALTAQRRQEEEKLHHGLCVSERLSDSFQPSRKFLIKKFNRRLNYIIHSVCFSFQIHSCIAINPVGPCSVGHWNARSHFFLLLMCNFFFLPVFFLNVFFFSPLLQLPPHVFLALFLAEGLGRWSQSVTSVPGFCEVFLNWCYGFS